MKLSFSDIQTAKVRLSPWLKKTGISRSVYFSRLLNRDVFFKWESEQHTKSFKIRGALNKILSLTDKERARGLITASAGNHAQGVALAANRLNIKARVVMMETASQVKVSACQKWGAEVILKGKNYDESHQYAQTIKGDSIFIHPFADPKIMAGQGTLGIEIIKDLPEAQSVVLSVGGGGLLSGVSLALKKLKPSVKVYGVVWEGAADFCFHFNKEDSACLCGKDPFPSQTGKSGLTDGITVKKSSPPIVALCRKNVDGLACVSATEIAKCIAGIKKQEGVTVEGSGAAALAGALKHSKKWKLGKKCCIVISGANIDKKTLSRVLTSPRDIY